ncbi:hypothetical protein [Ornithinimicrobium kibberense]
MPGRSWPPGVGNWTLWPAQRAAPRRGGRDKPTLLMAASYHLLLSEA